MSIGRHVYLDLTSNIGMNAWQAMRRVTHIVLLGAFAGTILCAWYVMRFRQSRASNSSSIKQRVQTVASNPVEFAKSRLTGGIGVAIGADATGFPRIHAVRVGSPADRAGLREGDLITKVDGLATKGRTMAQVAESVTGFSGVSVGLSVQRGSTNFECVIPRSSWNALRTLSSNPYE